MKNVEIVISSPPNGTRCTREFDESMDVSFEVRTYVCNGMASREIKRRSVFTFKIDVNKC